MDNFSTDTWNRLNIEAKPLVPRSCHLFYRCEPQKKEKPSKEKESLLGRLKEKQEFLLVSRKKDAQEKSSERDIT